MGWTGKVVGGVVGALMGGPVGAAAGAAMGHAADEFLGGGGNEPEDAEDDLPMELRFFEDEVGLGLLFRLGVMLPGELVLVVRFMDEDEQWYVAGVEDFADEDGDFVISGEIQENVALLYLPYMALSPPSRGEYMLVATVVAMGDEPEVVGVSRFVLELKKHKWRPVKYWRPLIGLLMAVAGAGSNLTREKVTEVRRTMMVDVELPPSERERVKRALKREPTASVEEHFEAFQMRFPAVPGYTLFESLVGVAKADGRVDSAELEILHQVALLLGVEESDWLELAEEYELLESVVLEQAWALLEVGPQASVAQIKTAFRKKVARYHPDRVQDLPPEFQQLAHDKTIELQKARDLLLSAH